jgi:hypothetical protein
MALLSLNLPVIGQQSATEDQKTRDALAAIQTGVNGNLDETNVPNLAAAFTTYKTVLERTAILNAGAAAGTYSLGATTLTNTGFVGALTLNHTRFIEPSFLAADARTTKFRLRVLIIPNTTAPAVTFTPSLQQITGFGGAAVTPVVSAASLVTGSNAGSVASPGATSQNVTDSTDFTIPGSAAYAIVVATSGTLAANSQVTLVAELLVRQV